MLGVALFGVGELEEHGAALLVGVVGEAAEQRAAGHLVGVHVLDALEPLRVESRRRHGVTVSSS